jgi:hypothetical protein
MGFYVLAKAFEALDRQIFQLGHLVSGHTLKHLAAAPRNLFPLSHGGPPAPCDFG